MRKGGREKGGEMRKGGREKANEGMKGKIERERESSTESNGSYPCYFFSQI